MNKRNVQLNRLFARVRATADAPAGGMPLALQTRVLAHWRTTAAEESGRGLALVFRFALLGAAVIMVVSIAWSFQELASDPENDIAIANYELRQDVMP